MSPELPAIGEIVTSLLHRKAAVDRNQTTQSRRGLRGDCSFDRIRGVKPNHPLNVTGAEQSCDAKNENQRNHQRVFDRRCALFFGQHRVQKLADI